MEKKVKNLYSLSCNWYMSELDEINASLPMYISKEWIQNAAGEISGSFSGNFVLFDDNTLIGYAKDKSSSKINQLIIGAVVEGKGISFCKVYADDFISNPTYYSALVNASGLSDSYYGDFSSTKTLYDSNRLGEVSIRAIRKERDEAEIKNIIEIYNSLREQIKMTSFLGNAAVNVIEGTNPKETSTTINETADMMYHVSLPASLQQEIIESQKANQ